MRILLTAGLGAVAFLTVVCGPAYTQHSARKESCAPSGEPTTVNVPAAKVCVHMSPPEVVVQQANDSCEKGGFLQRCCHFHHRRTPYYAAPAAPTYMYAAPAAPVAMSPMTFAPAAYAPAAPAFAPAAFAPAAPSYSFSPMTFAPSASLSIAPMTMAAPTISMPIGFPVAPAPAAPAPTPPAPAAPAAAELNESLKKLADSVDTLTKMVRQQTKILEYHENRLDDLEKKVQGLLDAQKGKTPGKTTSINTTHAPPAPEAVERIHAPLGAPIRVGVLPADDRK